MPELKSTVIWISAAIGFSLMVATLVFAFNTLRIMPDPPTLSVSTNAADQDTRAKEIANYKELAASLQSQRTTVFEFAVIRTVLPIFTSLLTAVVTFIFVTEAGSLLRQYLSFRNNRGSQ